MIKKIISLIIVVLILVLSVGITAYAENFDTSYPLSITTLRAGGGGGGGGGSGGGGGGGSSGGTHHYSGTERPPTLFESIIEFILLPFVLFSSSIIFYIKLTKRSRKAKKLMKQMQKSDHAWKYKNISAVVEKSFFAIQNAWANLDMAPAAQYMSDELYNNFQTKLNWMAYRNEKNILENIKLLEALPVAVHDDSDNSLDYIWFYIKGKMVDYTINTETQLKTNGSTTAASFMEYWQFTRKENTWVLNKILQKDEADQIPFAD